MGGGAETVVQQSAYLVCTWSQVPSPGPQVNKEVSSNLVEIFFCYKGWDGFFECFYLKTAKHEQKPNPCYPSSSKLIVLWWGLSLTLTHSAFLLEVVRMYAWLMEKISTLPRLHNAMTHSWHFGGFVMEIVVPSSSSYQVDTWILMKQSRGLWGSCIILTPESMSAWWKEDFCAVGCSFL